MLLLSRPSETLSPSNCLPIFMEGIGFVSKNTALLNQAQSGSIFTLQEQALLDAVQISMYRSDPPPKETVSTTGPGFSFTNFSHLSTGMRATRLMSDPSNRVPWKRDVRMSFYRQLESAGNNAVSSNDSRLRGFLASAAANPAILDDPASLTLITEEIAKTICMFMLWQEEDLQITHNLATKGIDSLVSIEIRNWWRRALGGDISVLEIMKAGTVERLGLRAISGLQKHLAS